MANWIRQNQHQYAQSIGLYTHLFLQIFLGRVNCARVWVCSGRKKLKRNDKILLFHLE